MLTNIFLVNRWRKKLSICGNCYFILTLLGVCHETVNFVLPLNLVKKSAVLARRLFSLVTSEFNCSLDDGWRL